MIAHIRTGSTNLIVPTRHHAVFIFFVAIFLNHLSHRSKKPYILVGDFTDDIEETCMPWVYYA